MANPDWAVVVWFAANFITGLGYFLIPYEIGMWVRGSARGTGFVVLARMFQVVFAACGLHHLVMLGLVGHHPTPWWQVAADGFMGFVTLVAAWVMYRNRLMIRNAFQTMLTHWKEWRPEG